MARAKKAARSQPKAGGRRRAIIIKIDEEIRNELEVLSLNRDKSIQELGVEAICDLLRKYGRPVSLMDALKRSAGRKTKRSARKKRSS